VAGTEPYAVQIMFYFRPRGSRGQALHQDNFYLRPRWDGGRRSQCKWCRSATAGPSCALVEQTRWFSSRPGGVGHERAERTTVCEHDWGRDREGSDEKRRLPEAKRGYPVWNTPLATPNTFLASSSCFIARTMSALGVDNRSCNNLLRNLPIP
jgi:hypothetical protein